MERLTYLAEHRSGYWAIEAGTPWPSRVPIGDTGIEWEVFVDLISKNVSMRVAAQGDDSLSSQWNDVLSAWATALETKNYEIREDGTIFIDSWAGLGWW